MAIIKPPVVTPWADAGDTTDPGDGVRATGWPHTDLPTARGIWNYILNYCANGVRYLSRFGVADYDEDEDYEEGSLCRSATDAQVYRCAEPEGSAQDGDPSEHPEKWVRLADKGWEWPGYSDLLAFDEVNDSVYSYDQLFTNPSYASGLQYGCYTIGRGLRMAASGDTAITVGSGFVGIAGDLTDASPFAAPPAGKQFMRWGRTSGWTFDLTPPAVNKKRRDAFWVEWGVTGVDDFVTSIVTGTEVALASDASVPWAPAAGKRLIGWVEHQNYGGTPQINEYSDCVIPAGRLIVETRWASEYYNDFAYPLGNWTRGATGLMTNTADNDVIILPIPGSLGGHANGTRILGCQLRHKLQAGSTVHLAVAYPGLGTAPTTMRQISPLTCDGTTRTEWITLKGLPDAIGSSVEQPVWGGGYPFRGANIQDGSYSFGCLYIVSQVDGANLSDVISVTWFGIQP